MVKQLDYNTLREIFDRFKEAANKPEGELEHVNVYTLVVAVALSAQSTDAGVNKATKKLFQIADTPEKMLDLGERGLIEHIKTIGLFRNKAKNVIKLSKILLEQYDGQVPNSRAALQSLPGVGRKTANVVLNMWWKHPAQAVDTHIFRVGNRTGIAPGKDVDAVERAIEDNVPADFQLHAHHWLILHGHAGSTSGEHVIENLQERYPLLPSQRHQHLFLGQYQSYFQHEKYGYQPLARDASTTYSKQR